MNPTKNETLANPEKRQFLAGLTAIAGAVAASALLSDKTIAAAMAYQSAANSQNQQAKVFSSKQLATLKQVCAVVIPATDTLGAAEIDCPGCI